MRARDDIADLLEPVRDLYVSELLNGLAEALGSPGEVDAEPVDRDADGRIRRHAPLDLPMRHDLRVCANGRAVMRRIPGRNGLDFSPQTLRIGDFGAARIAPFNWGAADIRIAGAPGVPNWTPIRRWYLEWFQARFGEESPDLLGVVHALGGPVEGGSSWRMTIDFGSASVSCFAALLDAFANTGCAEVRIGETEEAR